MQSRFTPCLLACFMLAACSKTEVNPTEGLPALDNLEPDPARLPSPPAKTPAAVTLRHILSSYQGSLGAGRKVKRNQQQARQRAQALLKLARAKDQDFAELARKYSDDLRNARSGGDLGLVHPGDLHPALERAAFSLQIGQVSGVVEGPRGFHILQRVPTLYAQAAEIVVAYQGAKRYRPRTQRSREQARALADRILKRLQAGASFEEQALAHSDHPNHLKGGYLPLFKKGSHPPQFEQIVFGLEIGQTSGVVETSTGFHIVKRLPPLQIQVRQIEIRHTLPGKQPEEEEQAQPLPSRQEAFERIQEIRKLALEPGADFAELASKYSDDNSRFQGGLLSPFGRGKFDYSFEKAAFGLKVGELSEIVETETGFQLIKRIR